MQRDRRKHTGLFRGRVSDGETQMVIDFNSISPMTIPGMNESQRGCVPAGVYCQLMAENGFGLKGTFYVEMNQWGS